MYPNFTTALFTVGKIWKQPKCPSIEIKKLWYTYTHTHTHIHTMGYYLAINEE